MKLTWRREQPRNKQEKEEINNAAISLLDNVSFQAAMEDIEKAYLEMWITTSARDVEAREKLYLTIQLLKKLKEQLSIYCADYKINKENERIDLEYERFKRNAKKML